MSFHLSRTPILLVAVIMGETPENGQYPITRERSEAIADESASIIMGNDLENE